MSSRILMLRHGITEGNKNKWFYGALDLPLIEEGREALIKLRDSKAYPEAIENTQFLTTGLIRTEETLEILYGQREHDAIRDLREMDFGEYEAKTFNDLKDDPAFQSWTYDETGDVSFPGGESRNGFTNRIRGGIKELLSRHKALELQGSGDSSADALTVLICHGGVVATIMHELFPGEREDMWHWIPHPGGGYLITFGEEGPSFYEEIDGTTPTAS